MRSIRGIRRLLVAVAAALSLCCPAWTQLVPDAQQIPDLLNGQDARLETQVGTYSPDASGDQSWVREYDGREFNTLGIELFNTYGYNKRMQYWLSAQDLIVGDEAISFGFANQNPFRLSGSTKVLTHRLQRVPANNPWAAAQLSALIPAVPAVVPGRTWDTFIDLSPDGTFGFDRRFNQLSGYANADKRKRLGLVAGWWEEQEHGTDQFLFRARQAQPGGPLRSGDRAAVALPVDRKTNQNIFGADWQVGNSSVINYRFVGTSFGDSREQGIGSLNFLPLNSLTRIGSKTSSHVFKARSKISKSLDFTGVHINKNRSNVSNDIPAGYLDEGTTLRKRQRIDTTNLALIYRPTRALSFTSRWRQEKEDNLIPPIFRLSNGIPASTPANKALSRKLNSFEIESVYTGIPRTYLRAEFEKRDLDREANELQPGNDDLTLPETSLSSNWNIWRVAARYHPTLRLNMSANYENWSAGDSGYVGVPNNLTRAVANATYMIRDNAAIYGDFSQWKESNDQIRFAGAIPDEGTTAEEEEERVEAAGQGLDSKFTTANIGGWFAASDKLTFDVNYGKVTMNSGTTWIIGYEPNFLPHLPDQFVPFKSNSLQWSLGANYRVNPLWNVYCRFLQVDSEGASLVDSADFAGLGPKWTPVEVTSNTWTLGFGRDLSKRDRLSLDFSAAKWTDKIDAGQTGRYNLWRLAWTRQY